MKCQVSAGPMRFLQCGEVTADPSFNCHRRNEAWPSIESLYGETEPGAEEAWEAVIREFRPDG